MRYTLFGQGEGVRSDPVPGGVWASVCRGVVTDASISARARGIRPGMPVSAAQALCPEAVLQTEDDAPTPAMQAVWRTLWSFSPWLETVEKDAFFLQVAGTSPPLTEIREILRALDQCLGEEQRVRAGLAESPHLARALVEWSRIERVPQALYRKAGRQQLLLSPSLCGKPEAQMPPRWILGMPIQALWVIPEPDREALVKLGVYRLADLEAVPAEELVRHFGKASLYWREVFRRPGGAVRINYPPARKQAVWTAEAGTGITGPAVANVIQPLLASLARALQRAGEGACKVGLRWRSEAGEQEYERVLKAPVWRADVLAVHLEEGLLACQGAYVDRIEVYLEDIRPLAAVQSAFTVAKGAWVHATNVRPADRAAALERLIRQINRKFPRQLQMGAVPEFRELRMQAILQTS